VTLRQSCDRKYFYFFLILVLTGFFQFFSKYSFAFKAIEIGVFGWFLDLYKEL